jgi:hypothetical protein
MEFPRNHSIPGEGQFTTAGQMRFDRVQNWCGDNSWLCPRNIRHSSFCRALQGSLAALVITNADRLVHPR